MSERRQSWLKFTDRDMRRNRINRCGKKVVRNERVRKREALIVSSSSSVKNEDAG